MSSNSIVFIMEPFKQGDPAFSETLFFFDSVLLWSLQMKFLMHYFHFITIIYNINCETKYVTWMTEAYDF